MRKGHTKSRLGCKTCKKRKVKCDEVKPQCGRCAQFGVHCDFSPHSSQPQLPANPKPGPRRQGRPRSDWASWSRQVQLRTPEATSESSQQLNAADLELFHSYMTTTANTLHDGGQESLWREGVPRIGSQHNCILGLLLSLSAYHLARLRPADAPRYLSLAEMHSASALQSATKLLSHLNKDNSSAAYLATVLVCFVTLARGPSPGNLFLTGSKGQVRWVNLLRGVRLVVESTGWTSIFSGMLAEYAPSPNEDTPDEIPTGPGLIAEGVEDWRRSLSDVSDLIAVFAEERFKDAYISELEVLTSCCQRIFGNGHNAALNTNGRFEVVFQWVYQLSDIYIEGLSRKEAVSMIILGHFCVLLRTLESQYWFTQGWASHIISEILSTSAKYRRWLSWPLSYLQDNG